MKPASPIFRSRCFAHRGFSLVEVTLVIGIVSFALLAVVGLLPAGLQSVKNADDQSAAANTLHALAEALRGAESADGVNHSATFAGKAIAYSVGGGGSSNTWTDLNMDGNKTTGNEVARLAAQLEILRTPDAGGNPGEALVSVAWSGLDDPGWDADSRRWQNAEGSMTTGIQFLPRP
jgi:prepilin-type N-terminal cleavage/methylation domain-containing protein